MSAKTAEIETEAKLAYEDCVRAQRMPGERAAWANLSPQVQNAWRGVVERRATTGPGPLQYEHYGTEVHQGGSHRAWAKDDTTAKLIVSALNAWQVRER